MSSQDDPEARIRQLEQQSANHGAVELGADQYSGGVNPPPPLPPPVYGNPQMPPPPYGSPYQSDPYSAPPFGVSFPQGPKKGPPVALIFGSLAVFAVVVFGAFGAFVWKMSSDTAPVTSRPGASTAVPGGGGTFDTPSAEPSIAIPTMPSISGLPGSSETPTVEPGGQLSIAGIEKNVTVACNDGNINVSGVNNTVNLTGHCGSVTVSGVNNRVTVEGTDTISASGFDNQITYTTGDPQIDTSESNTVQRG
jgi:hypothetical protein